MYIYIYMDKGCREMNEGWNYSKKWSLMCLNFYQIQF